MRKRLQFLAIAMFCNIIIGQMAYGLTGNINVHDPSLIRVGNSTYVFSTGPSIRIRKTTDPTMVNDWTYVGTVWDTQPAWIAQRLGATPPDIWAPDINFWNGKYYLYYSASIVGQGFSATMGLMTATDIEGPWTDQGEVTYSNYPIDPNIVWVDTVPYITWGSWDGIYLHEIDPETGKLSTTNTTLSLLAKGIEASTIAQNGNYFYLFGSRGVCCSGLNSTYYTVVGRSTDIRGPYLAANGVDMAQAGRTTVMSGFANEIGPGGGDWFSVGSALYFGYHFYDGANNGMAMLNIRDLAFSNGWPVLSPPINNIVLDEPYSIINVNSQKAVEVKGSSTVNNALVQQFTYNGDANQQFYFSDTGNGYFRIIPGHAASMAIDAYGTADGDAVRQYAWSGGTNQQWYLIGSGSNYRIINRNDNRCLNVPGASKADNVALNRWTCSTEANTSQLFTLTNLNDTPETNTLKIQFMSKTATLPQIETGWETIIVIDKAFLPEPYESFSKFGSTVKVKPVWLTTPITNSIRAVNRTSNNYSGDLALVLSNYIAADMRTSSDCNIVAIKITGLPAGTYTWKSYHHDANDQHGKFTTKIENNAGTIVEDHTERLITHSQDITFTEGYVKSSLDNICQYYYDNITSAGVDDTITVSFKNILDPDPVLADQSIKFSIINGFVLSKNVVTKNNQIFTNKEFDINVFQKDGEVSIQGKGIKGVDIYSINGVLIKRIADRGGLVTFGKMGQGIYIVQVKLTDQQVMIKKIVVQ